MSEPTSSTRAILQATTRVGARTRRGPLLRGWRRTLAGAILLLVAVAGFGYALLGLRGAGWPQVGAYLVVAVVCYTGLSFTVTGIWGTKIDVAAWLCGAWVVLITLAAILAPILPLGEYEDTAKTLLDPVRQAPDLLSAHPLGTNAQGLDMLARIVWGARISLVVSLFAVLIGAVAGGILGLIAGFLRKIPDRIIGILTNALLAVPPLILLIALAAVLSPTPLNLALTLSLLALPSMVRIARANTMSYVQREFVLAGRSMGASNLRIMLRELAPNIVLPLASYAMVLVSVLIVAEASLSFLGLGTHPPTPSWGNMIAEAEGTNLTKYPHLAIVPGITLFLTVFAFNFLGEKARKRFDTRTAKL